MRRIFVIGMTTALITATSAIALADDEAPEAEHEDTEEVVELSEAQMRKAELIADYFAGDEATDEDSAAQLEKVLDLRSQTGWGAVYKLMLLAQAGVDIDAIEGGWAFGKHFKSLMEDEAELIKDAPKNLGQLKKQQRDEMKAERKANKGQSKKNG